MTAMSLGDLLHGIATPEHGDILVTGLTQDSRAVCAGDAFVALRGARHHGIEFAGVAVERGAVAVLAEKGPGTGDRGPGKPPTLELGPPGRDTTTGADRIPYQADPEPKAFGPRSPVPGPASPVIWVENLRTHLGAIAARFYGDPSGQVTVIGVTGTNGKTSVVQLLAQALSGLDKRAATIGTLGSGLPDALQAGERTTPDVIRVHGLLAALHAAGASHVAMEVSSHALDQQRVDAVRFDVAVFTNLTREHLDYHGTLEAYGAAKARLFAWPALRAAVINVDDAFGRELVARFQVQTRVLRYSIDADAADLRARNVSTHANGVEFDLVTPYGSGRVRSGLLGHFNVSNLLAVAGVLAALDVPFAQIQATLETLQPVAGRMSRLGGGALPLVVVDYAHTPDALEQVLATLREHCTGRLLCVFGCGGDRDAGKRPQMGAITERLADVAIITDDNPRSEDGDAIVAQIIAGMRVPDRAIVERDRARAIGLALARAVAGDVVLIAGKGHETYQENAGARRPFDDFKVARAALEARPC